MIDERVFILKVKKKKLVAGKKTGGENGARGSRAEQEQSRLFTSFLSSILVFSRDNEGTKRKRFLNAPSRDPI